MPVYYLKDNLTIKGKLHKRHTIDPLSEVSEKSRAGLVEKGLIRELSTPPVTAFEPLQKYATMLGDKGIVTLGDFAFADLAGLSLRKKADKAELETLQKKVHGMIHPDIPLVLDECGCIPNPSSIPLAE